MSRFEAGTAPAADMRRRCRRRRTSRELVERDPGRDRRRRPDHLRPVHGARALRAGARLLPIRGRATRAAAGDFLTAPETHPIFGAAIARQLDEVWQRLGRPEPFVVREHGAGTGALAARDPRRAWRGRLAGARAGDPLRADRGRRASPAPSSRPARRGRCRRRRSSRTDAPDPSTACVARQRAARRAAGPPGRGRRDGDCASCSSAWRAGAVRRGRGRAVDAGARGTARRRGRRARRGPAGGDLPRARRLDRRGRRAASAAGSCSLVDYGYPAAELYGPTRPAGTLRAYVGHRVHDDPSRTSAARTSRPTSTSPPSSRRPRRAGLDDLGLTSQAEFLVGLGARGARSRRSSRIRRTTLEAYLDAPVGARPAARPAATGGFRSWLFGRGVEPTRRSAASPTGWRADPGSGGRAIDRPRLGHALLPTGTGAGRTPAPPEGGSRTCTRARRGPLPDPSPLDCRARGRSSGHASADRPATASAGRMRLRATARSRVQPCPGGPRRPWTPPSCRAVRTAREDRLTGIWYIVGFAFAGVSFVFLTIGAAWLISHRNRGDDHKGLPYE